MGPTPACEDCKTPGRHPERWWKWDGDPAPYKLRLCQACLLKREEYVAGEPERQRIRAARDKARALRASQKLSGKCSHASPSSPAPTQQRTVGFFDSVRMQPDSVNLPQTDPRK